MMGLWKEMGCGVSMYGERWRLWNSLGREVMWLVFC